LLLWGIGWLEPGDTRGQPLDAAATQVWQDNESFAPIAPDVWFSGSWGPFSASFTVQPGTTYTLKQMNLSHLNFFDLGYFNARITSEISGAVVPGGFPVVFGTSWDGTSLQSILDAEYGAGAIDVATQYEGFSVQDADPPYWEGHFIGGTIVRELAGFQNTNAMGWYVETLSGRPSIDGVDDGEVFAGSMPEGTEVLVQFPLGVTRFGMYLNPNGSGDSRNAPEPEMFFTSRGYNDVGPDGSNAIHPPTDGDPQCLIFNITHLRNGIPTYVLAWEDNDSGGAVTPGVTPQGTDNDFNDLVVEIRALSPVPAESASWGQVKALFKE
jgi:hypothetical protein